jgi:hypothetical protein
MTYSYARVALLAIAVLATSAFAQDRMGEANDLQALRSAVRGDKKAYVASVLHLSDAEARKFWPSYDTYQRHLDAIGRRRAVVLEALVDGDRPISDAYARTLANELMAVDEAEIKARRTLQSKVMRTLPARKAARYLQLEAKIRAVEAYDIASAFPLAK